VAKFLRFLLPSEGAPPEVLIKVENYGIPGRNNAAHGHSQYIIAAALLFLAMTGDSPQIDGRAVEPMQDSRTEMKRLDLPTPTPHEAR